MQGVSHRHISDHLSDLVETTLTQLEESHVISIVDDFDLEPLNMGMIAAFYHIAYTTIELFARSLKPKTKVKGILETLCWASEFDSLPMRPGGSDHLHCPLASSRHVCDEAHIQANLLVRGKMGGYVF